MYLSIMPCHTQGYGSVSSLLQVAWHKEKLNEVILHNVKLLKFLGVWAKGLQSPAVPP
jgi:hypothetical protein